MNTLFKTRVAMSVATVAILSIGAAAATMPASTPRFPAGGLWKLFQLTNASLQPYTMPLGEICLDAPVPGHYAAQWTIVQYDGNPTNPDHGGSGRWGISVFPASAGDPQVEVPEIFGTGTEVGSGGPVTTLNSIVFNKSPNGQWIGGWTRWRVDDNADLYGWPRVVPVYAGPVTGHAPHGNPTCDSK
jgi:hypothetical protein